MEKRGDINPSYTPNLKEANETIENEMLRRQETLKKNKKIVELDNQDFSKKASCVLDNKNQ